MNTITTDIDSTEAKTPAEALSAFLTAIGATPQTRLIGLTATEWAAMDRGASLILGVPRDGMEPITAGQELLALDGWNHGDAPRMDVRRAWLRVTGEPYETKPVSMGDAEIEAVTGDKPVNHYQRLASFLIDLESERGKAFPERGYTKLLAIPFVVVP